MPLGPAHLPIPTPGLLVQAAVATVAVGSAAHATTEFCVIILVIVLKVETQMNYFQNKLAFITGGSSGIGLALAKKLAAAGAQVWIAARDPARLVSAWQEISGLSTLSGQPGGYIALDVSKSEAVQQEISRFKTQVGLPDLVINCAGAAHPGLFEEQTPEIFRWMMESNFFGTVHICQAFVPHMKQRGFGHIVNVSSMAGFLGTFGYTAYGASKYAVRGFSDALRLELKPCGVHVSIVFPPDTDTPQLAYESAYKPAITKHLTSTSKMLTPDRVAEITLAGVQRKAYIITPGFETTLFYYLSAHLGNLVYPVMDLLVKQAMRSHTPGENNTSRQHHCDPE